MNDLLKRVHLKIGDKSNGFEVISVKEVEDYHSVGIRLRHIKTGAEVYHLFNNDRENLFAFAFKTPPDDSTGVAHIVEHSVLSGSKRFPVKEPFVVLLNSSMNTYLNAMTFPDKTVYPASSLVEKDFYNLMLVYGDAVFFPLMRKETFMQEAYHVEFGGESSSGNSLGSGETDKVARFVGVVFNEMKGAYSDPEVLVEDMSYRSLFPDTPYGFDSGGEPWSIPDLTYEKFLNFHRRYYHPSNSHIFLYGNISTEKHLDFLNREFLSKFEPLDINVEIPFQTEWGKPVVVERTYPLKKGTDTGRKTTVLLNWAAVPVTDPYRLIIMEVISELLVGNPGSPLRKRLIESRLGEDLAPGTGLTTELKQSVFSVGLRGTDRERREAIENLVFDTLEELVAQGIDRELVDAAVHRVEFRNREIRGNGAPFALRLMRKTLRGWLHGLEPEETLIFNDYMDRLKSEIDNGFKLESLIKEVFLDNRHRSTVVVYPDPEYKDRISIAIDEKLAKIVSLMGESDRERVKKEVEKLRNFLESPDSKEDLDKIPTLRVEDIPESVEKIPIEEIDVEGCDLYFHDIYTNGVIYLDIGFDISHIDENMRILLPLLGRVICKSGLKDKKYDEVARLLAKFTGGFYTTLELSNIVGQPIDTFSTHMFFRVKALKARFSRAVSLVREIICKADFSDREHLKNVLVEFRNDFKGELIPEGHLFAMLRARSMVSKPARIEEIWQGVSQYIFLNYLVEKADREVGFIDELAETLESLREIILKGQMILNVTASLEDRNDVLMAIRKEFLDQFTHGEGREGMVNKGKGFSEFIESLKADPLISGKTGRECETLAVSSKVGFVSKALKARRFGDGREPFQSILAHLLRTGYLWERIRMKGGAYGAFAFNYSSEGTFVLCSYRDPNIVNTLLEYRNGLSSIEELSDRQFKNSILGTIGREERPIDPGEKGFVSLKRLLGKITDELREERRKIMKFASREAIVRVAHELESAYSKGGTVVIAGREMIEREKEHDEKISKNIFELPE